jgi:hypothetical protein
VSRCALPAKRSISRRVTAGRARLLVSLGLEQHGLPLQKPLPLAAEADHPPAHPRRAEQLAVEHDAREVLAVGDHEDVAVACAVVLGVVIPRAVARGGSPATALTLSLLGLVLAAAYWSGIPPVLARGGVVLARRSAPGGVTRAALAVGVLALVADLAILIVDGVGS